VSKCKNDKINKKKKEKEGEMGRLLPLPGR
jgi:hypothetical protein